jgi:SpoVK/Ycf46/Vps4 family AAA+-type ATPase
METLDGILIATTNLTQNLDSAMERRILYKVKFDKPETAVKAQLWQSFIPDLTDEQAEALALRYDFSGGQIENVKRKSVVDNILTGKEVDFEQINDYCTREMLDNKRVRIGFNV